MSDYRDIIIRPLVTEKTLKTQADHNTVVFEVRKGVNKIHIRQAIEALFKVKVVKVNVVNVKAKAKRVGRYQGKTKAIRKAYIKLAPDSNITILSDK